MLSYKGYVKSRLEALGIKDYDRVKIVKDNAVFEGLLVPRPKLLDDKHIILKLDNGYNVGVKIDDETTIQILSRGKQPVKHRKLEKEASSKERISIVFTGGTIASKVDYETGAVRPYESPEELESLIPELREISDIEYYTAMSIFSEDMTPADWIKIAEITAKLINSGSKGVIIGHGTDTMHYTAAALSFMLRNQTAPVVLVGAQRSIDRGSSDAVLNLIASAMVAARSDIAETVVVMHATPEDEYCHVIRGVRARKMHTSRRDAFLSVNDKPIAIVTKKEIKYLTNDYNRRRDGKISLDTRIEPKVGLIYSWPSMESKIIDAYINMGYKGLVIAGTGLGHIPNRIIPKVEEAVSSGVVVVIASQCIFGRVNMKVYSTGRRLLAAGAIPAYDMHPETALVKLMYVLGHTADLDEIRRLMAQNMVGEIRECTSMEVYPPGCQR